MGTPKYIIGQTVIVASWIFVNASALVGVIHFDPFPFILLNLAFSLQSAYAAPLILLAQTRQADRDKALVEADVKHREEIAALQAAQLKVNTDLTKEVHALSVEIRTAITKPRRRAKPKPRPRVTARPRKPKLVTRRRPRR